MKEYSALLWSLEFEPHYQMQINVMHQTPPFLLWWDLTPLQGIKSVYSKTQRFNIILHIDFWQNVSCGFLNRICTCVNKETAEINHVNWDPEGKKRRCENIVYWFAVDTDTRRDSESSHQVSRPHPTWEPKILSGALKIETQRGLRRYGVNDSSLNYSSLSLSLSHLQCFDPIE